MATTVEDVIAKVDKVEINETKAEEPNGKSTESGGKAANEAKTEEVGAEVEPKTGVSFAVKLDDGKRLNCVGVRKKSMVGMSIKIYAFGICFTFFARIRKLTLYNN